jgi:hypothetical protein
VERARLDRLLNSRENTRQPAVFIARPARTLEHNPRSLLSQVRVAGRRRFVRRLGLVNSGGLVAGRGGGEGGYSAR